MPFNYDSTLQYQGIAPRVLQSASKSPFEIAGNAMTTLEQNIDDRAFEKQIGKAQTLQDLTGLTPTTAKSQAMLANKQGIFNALNQQEQRQRVFDLQQQQQAKPEAFNVLTNEQEKLFGLDQAGSYQRDSSGKVFTIGTPRTTAGVKAIADPTGGIVMYDKAGKVVNQIDAPAFGAKTQERFLPNIGTVATDSSGDPIRDSEGKFIITKAPTGLASQAKTDAKKAEQEEKKKLKVETDIQKAELVTGDLADLKNRIVNQGTFDEPITGVTGAIYDLVPGTARNSAVALLDTIQANIGFEELSAMKAASPTGGALGSISENELKFLQSVKGSLDLDQEDDALIKQIDKITKEYNRIQLKALAYDKDTGSIIKQVKDNRPDATDEEIIQFIKFKGL